MIVCSELMEASGNISLVWGPREDVDTGGIWGGAGSAAVAGVAVGAAAAVDDVATDAVSAAAVAEWLLLVMMIGGLLTMQL